MVGGAWWAEGRGRHWPGSRAPVVAAGGMVASSNPLAVTAGMEVLARGGSAVDAVIAVDAVLGVVEPHLTGIGGDCAAIVCTGDAPPVGLNATGPAPRAASIEALRSAGWDAMPVEGPLAVTVPGAVAGWAALHARFGRLSPGDLLEPAIRYATDGAPLAPVDRLMWQRQLAKLRSHRDLAAHYLVNEDVPPTAHRLRSPALAATLATLAHDGLASFYQGALADRLVAATRRAGGLIALEDLTTYEAQWVQPLSTSLQGYTVWELPPNTQGLTVLIALDMLRELGLDNLRWGTGEYCHLVLEVLRRALEIRDTQLGDPVAMRLAPDAFLARDFTRGFAAGIDRKRATPPRTPSGRPAGTVYIAAADARGMIVSFISSVYMHFGSGIVAGDTGVLLQNRGAAFRLEPGHPQALAPGRRPLHTIIPGLVTGQDGFVAAFGVTGADMQPQGHVQVLLNLLCFEMTAQEALEAPRLRLEPDGRVAVEAGIGAEVRRDLEERGHHTFVDDPLGFGAAQLVVRDRRTGVLAGATEPRRDGAVAAR